MFDIIFENDKSYASYLGCNYNPILIESIIVATIFHNYKIHFGNGQIPPVKPGGFWSLPVYDENGFLVSNPLIRHVTNEETE